MFVFPTLLKAGDDSGALEISVFFFRLWLHSFLHFLPKKKN
jgi:hypothetical protein